jgi:hypothetical protein
MRPTVPLGTSVKQVLQRQFHAGMARTVLQATWPTKASASGAHNPSIAQVEQYKAIVLPAISVIGATPCQTHETIAAVMPGAARVTHRLARNVKEGCVRQAATALLELLSQFRAQKACLDSSQGLQKWRTVQAVQLA